ncbi:hypothetical protein KAR91_72090 [Candidatus Pacearchaeota archaeon]|nr:hypothetical protein [Candidatus Pacearchaeota archaeon]
MSEIKNIPDKIYLQVDPDEWIADDEEPTEVDFHALATEHEVTWCEDCINNSDVAYLKEELTLKVADALAKLLLACWKADEQADLSHEVDGSLMDTARIILDDIPNYTWRPQ